jgi:DHA1 family bicyclomycin/chloramphenicol resistance-like MFS transporter
MHYGSGILSAAMVSWFSDGTPWTMAWIMAAAGVSSLATSLISTHIHREAVPELSVAGNERN